MIYKIKGVLIFKSPNLAVIDTGNIAIEVNVSVYTYTKLPEVGKIVELYTHLIVKEDAISLCGFYNLEEKEVFIKLNKVSKIGPKSALAILSGIFYEELKKVISNQDIQKLSSIPGIGKKTAERIVLELKDSFEDDFIEKGIEGASKLYDDVLSALINLGYRKGECIDIINSAINTEKTFEGLLKECLKKLAN